MITLLVFGLTACKNGNVDSPDAGATPQSDTISYASDTLGGQTIRCSRQKGGLLDTIEYIKKLKLEPHPEGGYYRQPSGLPFREFRVNQKGRVVGAVSPAR